MHSYQGVQALLANLYTGQKNSKEKAGKIWDYSLKFANNLIERYFFTQDPIGKYFQGVIEGVTFPKISILLKIFS